MVLFLYVLMMLNLNAKDKAKKNLIEIYQELFLPDYLFH